eukprot:1261498-Lingulodinium_polyedra.AAC.1
MVLPPRPAGTRWARYIVSVAVPGRVLICCVAYIVLEWLFGLLFARIAPRTAAARSAVEKPPPLVFATILLR